MELSMDVYRNRTRVRWAVAVSDTRIHRAFESTWRTIQSQRLLCPISLWRPRTKQPWLAIIPAARRDKIRFRTRRNISNRIRHCRSTGNRIIGRIRLRILIRTRTRTCSKRICVRSIGFPWTLTVIKSTCRSSRWSVFSSTTSARTWTVQV